MHFLHRFNIKWIKNVTLRTYENIDKSDLKDKTKEYLKGLHKRIEGNSQLSKRPSMNDYRRLALAYGKTTRI